MFQGAARRLVPDAVHARRAQHSASAACLVNLRHVHHSPVFREPQARPGGLPNIADVTGRQGLLEPVHVSREGDALHQEH